MRHRSLSSSSLGKRLRALKKNVLIGGRWEELRHGKEGLKEEKEEVTKREDVGVGRERK